MALQDLTPQLRTRLSRMERAVGWFVFLATALLLFGFGYYLYHTAERKGWFTIKAKFVTYISSAAGLKVGDAVVMKGTEVGRITLIDPLEPRNPLNVKVEFEVRDRYFRYIWRDGSVVKVNAADFLGKRQIEITVGTNGPAISVTQPITVFTNLDDLKHIAELTHDPIYAYNNTDPTKNHVVAVWRWHSHRYEMITPGSESAALPALESPAVTERLQKVVDQVQAALPNFLALTNQLSALLNNGANAASNVSSLAVSAQPIVTNANSLIVNLDTNVTATLISLSEMTSNLNAQVQENSNVLSSISKAVTDSDTFVQGLKHHWLLRSAFKNENKKTNAPPAKPISPKP